MKTVLWIVIVGLSVLADIVIAQRCETELVVVLWIIVIGLLWDLG
jgi:hypothetical protein